MWFSRYSRMVNPLYLYRMKKSSLLVAVILVAFTLFSQADSTLPPYKRFPSFPPVKLLKPDSSSFFSKPDLDKKAAVLLMLFNPQCEHCSMKQRRSFNTLINSGIYRS